VWEQVTLLQPCPALHYHVERAAKPLCSSWCGVWVSVGASSSLHGSHASVSHPAVARVAACCFVV
jgi:hypothetical protein